MEELLTAAGVVMEKYPDVYTGMRCSTRPDCISEEILALLKAHGMTAIELGAQSMSDEVLQLNRRGHTAEDVRRASELIKRSGIELGLQMMTGLYGDSEAAVIRTMEEFIALAPATVRIYPTVILEGTHLGELYKSGEYRTFDFEQTVELCARMLREFTAAGISVIRMGLHASEDVEKAMLGGVYHPAFREICESRIFLGDMKKALSDKEKGDYIIYTDARNISRATGQKRCNIEALSALGYNVSVRACAGEYIKLCAK